MQELGEDSIGGLDLVLSSAGGSVSAEWTPKLVAAGAIVVDNTSYWRMNDDVPLVVAEVNPEALEGHSGIIANPNCSTMQMVVALKPLYDAAGIERLVVSTYQAVSGTGKAAIDELARPGPRRARRPARPKPPIYPHQIAFNVLAQAGSFPDGDDHTDEERKLINETAARSSATTRSGSAPPVSACPPAFLPVSSTSTVPVAPRTTRTNPRLGSVLRHATQVRCGTCLGRCCFADFTLISCFHLNTTFSYASASTSAPACSTCISGSAPPLRTRSHLPGGRYFCGFGPQQRNRSARQLIIVNLLHNFRCDAHS